MDAAPPRTRRVAPPPKFVTGSLLRHVLVMTGASALGLMAIFVGDLANIFFLSMLKVEAIVAAVGYASSIAFFTISIGIGFSIAASALVAPAIGAGERRRAARLSTNAHLVSFIGSALLSVVVLACSASLLRMMGANGHTAALAEQYLWILIPALPPLALAMTSAAVLRAVGDAGRSMHVTLGGALVNMVLDPLLIFGLDLGLHGAAYASAAARLVMMAIGLYGVIVVHGLMARYKRLTLLRDVRPILAIAGPAVLTNVATPAGNAYVTAAVAPFGDGAVAGWAIVGRILPVAFGAIYALSGSVGPIVGQNYGARSFDRMREALVKSIQVTAAFTMAAWLVLAIFADTLATTFHATGEARDLIVLFCRWLAPLFMFLGALFISNAVFNTLGRADVPAWLNWARATVGTIPFVHAGAWIAGAEGVLTGHMIGGVPFGILAVALCFGLINRLDSAYSSGAGGRTFE